MKKSEARSQKAWGKKERPGSDMGDTWAFKDRIEGRLQKKRKRGKDGQGGRVTWQQKHEKIGGELRRKGRNVKKEANQNFTKDAKSHIKGKSVSRSQNKALDSLGRAAMQETDLPEKMLWEEKKRDRNKSQPGGKDVRGVATQNA